MEQFLWFCLSCGLENVFYIVTTNLAIVKDKLEHQVEAIVEEYDLKHENNYLSNSFLWTFVSFQPWNLEWKKYICFTTKLCLPEILV